MSNIKMSHPNGRGGSSLVELVRVQARIRRAEQVQRSRADLLQGRLIPEDPDIDIGV